MDFSLAFTPDLIAVFATLFVLEIVLGVDNVIFISILASKLPKEQQARARNLGLTLAMLIRVVLVFFAGWGRGDFISSRGLFLVTRRDKSSRGPRRSTAPAARSPG